MADPGKPRHVGTRMQRLPDGTLVRVQVYDSRKRGKRSTPRKGKPRGKAQQG